jgi:hypothetical protein
VLKFGAAPNANARWAGAGMGIMALFTGALALKTWRSLKLAGAESISESVTIAKALRRYLM